MADSVLSQILGWLYFLAWGTSNYPQVIMNYKRKAVSGYSLDLFSWNVLGFIFYTIYTIVGYIMQRRYDLTHSIAYQDIAFACNALVVMAIIGSQVYTYRDTITVPLNRYHATGIVILVTLALYNVCLGIGGFLPWFSHKSSSYAFSVVQFLGFSKSFISFIKYIPQVLLNYRNQSTQGWSILNVLLDVTGGLCSLMQMVTDGFYDTKPGQSFNWEHLTGNVPKLILAIESMMFDVIFMVQHYILYAENNKRKDELQQKLLEEGQHLSLNSEGYIS